MSEEIEELQEVIREARTAELVSLVSPVPGLTHTFRDDVDTAAREIFLCGEIVEASGAWFLQSLRFFEKNGEGPVKIWINSPGGDVSTEFAIHDAIRTSTLEIWTIGVGEVASAAGLLLACGTRRFVTESTVFMAHEPKGYGGDNGIGLRAAKDRRAWEDWQHEHWAELMGRYCKGGKTAWKQRVEKGGEFWLLGGAAIIGAGIADELWTARTAKEGSR